jgi:signal transduction histidine kinase
MSTKDGLATNAEERLSRMIVRALAYLRAGQLALWLWVPIVEGPSQFPQVVLVGYGLMAAWSVMLFSVGIWRNRITPRWLAADVAIAVICAVVISRAYPLGEAVSSHNWVLSPICGTAVTVAVYASGPTAVTAVGLIAVAWLAGTWRDTASSNALSVFADAVVIVVFAVVARFGSRLLLQSARQADAATSLALQSQRRAAEAQRREAEAEARDRERKRQYDKLHDTVLHTLENISRGVLDAQSRQARENCQRDAEYLRGLITGGLDNIPTDLGTALASVARDRSALGSFRINHQFDALPANVPESVAEALAGAVREALNNAGKYAEVDEAWLTAQGDGRGGVSVSVVDRGVGFDLEAPRSGLGLTRSISHRVEEVGGKINISSAPGEGTVVEMTWTP